MTTEEQEQSGICFDILMQTYIRRLSQKLLLPNHQPFLWKPNPSAELYHHGKWPLLTPACLKGIAPFGFYYRWKCTLLSKSLLAFILLSIAMISFQIIFFFKELYVVWKNVTKTWKQWLYSCFKYSIIFEGKGCRNHRITSLTFEINSELRTEEEREMFAHLAHCRKCWCLDQE